MRRNDDKGDQSTLDRIAKRGLREIANEDVARCAPSAPMSYEFHRVDIAQSSVLEESSRVEVQALLVECPD
jgi:hypothetical protein